MRGHPSEYFTGASRTKALDEASPLEHESSAAKSHVGAAWGRGGATGQGTAARAPPGADPQLGSVRCCVPGGRGHGLGAGILRGGVSSPRRTGQGVQSTVSSRPERSTLLIRSRRHPPSFSSIPFLLKLSPTPPMFNVHGEVSAVAAVTAVFQGSRGCLRSCIHLTSPGRESGPVFLI